jgi:hypothetical protein
MNNYTKLNELILELDKSTDLIGYCSVANVCKRLERIESNKPELKSALAEFNNLTEEEKYEYVSSVLNVETDFNFPHTINGPIRLTNFLKKSTNKPLKRYRMRGTDKVLTEVPPETFEVKNFNFKPLAKPSEGVFYEVFTHLLDTGEEQK